MHVVAVAPPAGAGSRRGRIVVKDELVLVLLGGRLVLALELDALADPGQLATACARRPVRACARSVLGQPAVTSGRKAGHVRRQSICSLDTDCEKSTWMRRSSMRTLSILR